MVVGVSKCQGRMFAQLELIDMAIIIIIVVGVHRLMAESGCCCFSAIATCVYRPS